MGADDSLGTGGADAVQQALPIAVIGEDKTPVHGPATACSPEGHPAGSGGRFVGDHLADPGAAVGAGWSQDEAAFEFGLGGFAGDPLGWGQGNEGPQDFVHVFDGGMGVDGADAGVQVGKQALGLAEGVTEEYRGFALGAVAGPPGVEAAEDFGLGAPAEGGQAKGAFRDKGMAGNRFVGLTEAIGFVFVVAGEDPDLALVLDPDLGGSEDVPGGVQTEAHALDGEGFVPLDALDVDLPEAVADDGDIAVVGEVIFVAPLAVVAVPVGDDGLLDGPPGVQVDISRGAVNAFRVEDEEVGGCGHALS